MRSVTVHLSGRYAPGDQDWHRACLDQIRANGNVVVCSNSYGSDRKEYPAHVVVRIDYHD